MVSLIVCSLAQNLKMFRSSPETGSFRDFYPPSPVALGVVDVLFTVCFWHKPLSLDDICPLIQFPSIIEISLKAFTGEFIMKVVQIEETSTIAMAEMGFWQHACGKKSLTKFDLLINGIQTHTINPPSTGWG